MSSRETVNKINLVVTWDSLKRDRGSTEMLEIYMGGEGVRKVSNIPKGF